MREVFLKKLTQLARIDKDIVLLTADLGYGVFEKFEEEFPKQYFNVGVAEQNMTTLATGLALEGKKVITYSIGNFPTLRCLEQIRNSACYHDANITIVASGGGFSYGALGMSHHTTEDIAILRALPNITVVAPSTIEETFVATENLIKQQNVSYLRLDKTVVKNLPKENFSLGKAIRYKEGKDITLITTGGILKDVLIAAEYLKNKNIATRVVNMHTIKPIDEQEIIASVNETKGIVTIEEHNKTGGLGEAVATVCVDNGILPKVFYRIALNDIYSSVVGDQDFLKKYYKIDSQTIINKVLELLK